MPKKKKSTGDWVERQNFRTPKTLKLRPVVGPIRTVEVNRKRRARLELSEDLSEENLETSGEDEFTFSQDRENEPSPPHRRSFTGDISLDSNQNNRKGVRITVRFNYYFFDYGKKICRITTLYGISSSLG